MARNYNLSKQGENFIKQNEGLRLIAYPDGKGINAGYSIGYGHYLQPSEIDALINSAGGVSISKQQAEWFFQNDALERVKALNAVLNVDISQPMFDALIDYGFSMSGTSLAKTELVGLINAGAAKDVVVNQWLNSWIKYGLDLNYKPLKDRRKREVVLAYSKLNEVFENVGLEYQNPLTVVFIAAVSLFGFGLVIYFILNSK